VKKWGGVLVKVDRENRGEFKGGDPKHSSETQLDGFDGWDYVLDNNGDLTQLYYNVENMLEEL
jgi:hypothetical protein